MVVNIIYIAVKLSALSRRIFPLLMEATLKHRVKTRGSARFALKLALSLVALSCIFGPQLSSAREEQQSARNVQHQKKLLHVLDNKAEHAAAIVRRWEHATGAKGRTNSNNSTELYDTLMRLQPENLLAAEEASSYDDMMNVVAAGDILPKLGLSSSDLVYTPVSPCRIVDTRKAGGAIAAGATRSFDVDGATFTAQGGFDGSCGIPSGVARAVAMTITSAQPSAAGQFRAWSVTEPQSSLAVLNFAAKQIVSNTTIVRVAPGAGNDFNVATGGSASSQLTIDVVGYFAASVATALDCITVESSMTAIPVNAWTPLDAFCPSGRTSTGGGYLTGEGTLGYPGVWTNTVPLTNGWRTYINNQTNGPRNMKTYARCCRVPGR
jgi:hypothetical protein